MTREQQKQLKLLKNSVMNIALPEIKGYKLKRKDGRVWQQKNGMFFSMLLFVSANDNNQCLFTALESVKPLWADDLLWDILDMPENKAEPLSLRSVGAFTVSGAEIVNATAELPNWELGELEEQISLSIRHFYESIQAVDEAEFYRLAEQPGYQSDMMKALILIHNGKYADAIRFVDTMENDWLSNAGRGFRERAKAYCEKEGI